MSVKRIILLVIAAVLLTGFTAVGVNEAVKTRDRLQFQDVQLKSRSTEIKDLELRYDNLDLELKKAEEQKNVNQDQLDKLNKEKEELEKQKQDLERQLQAKLQEKENNRLAATANKLANAVTGTQTAHAASASSGIDCNNQSTAKAFMYCHESGNSPTAQNEGV